MLSYPAQWFVVLALPLVYASVASLLMWKIVERPWLFTVVTVVVLYGLYIAVGFMFSEKSQGYFIGRTDSQAANASPATVEEIMSSDPIKYLIIRAYMTQFLVFSVLALPAIWYLKKLFRS